MGGHRAGEVASATALEALRAAITSGRPLRESIEDANEAVFTKSLTDTSLRGMGTTLTAGTLVAGDTLLVGHVGDSRAYLLHDGELRQVTVDHSLVEELVREGRLTADEAAVHPQRSIITRALGVDASVEVDVYPVELAPGDRLLLCSDGLTGMVQPDDIAATLRREEDPTRAATALVDAANAAGGEDNITVVVVAVTDEAPLRELPERDRAARGRPRSSESTANPHRNRASAAGAAVRGVGRVLLWALPIVLVLGIAVRRGRLVRAQGLLRRREPGSGHGVQGRARRPRRVEPDHRAAHRARGRRPAPGRRRPQVHDHQTFSSRADAAAFVARLRARPRRRRPRPRRPRRPPRPPTTAAPPTTADARAPAAP